jgi:hypothetical protein
MMILIAGPYRSGTNDEPAKMAENLARLEAAAWPIFDAGHVPMIGEWVMYPTAQRLLEHCDAVLRLPGASKGADQDVAIAQKRGLPVFYELEEIPRASYGTVTS